MTDPEKLHCATTAATTATATTAHRYDAPLGALPASLQTLHVGQSFSQLLGALPLGLRSLIVGHQFTHSFGPTLPSSLHTLVFEPSDDETELSTFDLPLGPLPQQLCVLGLPCSYDTPLGALPDSLERLVLRGDFNCALGRLPLSLTELVLSREYSHPLGQLPAMLTVLDLSQAVAFDHELPAPLPACLQTLRMRHGYEIRHLAHKPPLVGVTLERAVMPFTTVLQ
jgi:hypothetical protein